MVLRLHDHIISQIHPSPIISVMKVIVYKKEKRLRHNALRKKKIHHPERHRRKTRLQTNSISCRKKRECLQNILIIPRTGFVLSFLLYSHFPVHSSIHLSISFNNKKSYISPNRNLYTMESMIPDPTLVESFVCV